ncbi:uncharacterized protein FOMMEDRAFT_153804 [Fomitiporia mediterranea MF3/22]|uniref:uncharacterized protein n=1 Tax=Fomitiporia mediterranea (strain MF3/22) TaxID=694068 RepID=UPI00044076B5|nr:uncharacterized protein FOMMEDRAFT_153804 [Fomitiporia mediterranea MF3/22]EJD04726.1 hypothetical protein FOMMEDRAFT_153804 [Fomitiporia mediterranea MF3/22]
MSSPVSSVNLSVLSLALSSWLDGSAQLRRSLILFPLELGIAPSHDSNSSSSPALASQDDSDPPRRETEPIRLVDRCLQWFTKPARDLDEVEKVIVGALDLSSSVLLLKLLGSGPILPFILNPLSITLALPRKLSLGPVRWSQVVLLCFLLSTLHEAQRTSVATGIAWLRMKKAAKNEANVGEVVLRGEKLEETNEDEDDEPCVICSGGQSEGTTLSDSISSITSLSTTHTTNTNSNSNTNSNIPDPGPLEAFCVHAPTKHPMHRSCFLAWKDAYWEARASRPIITLVSDDSAVPLPGTWQWRRAQAILASLGARIWNMTYYVPLAPAELTESTGVNGVGETGKYGLCLATLSRLSIRSKDDLCSRQVKSTSKFVVKWRTKYAFEITLRLDQVVETVSDWSDYNCEDCYSGVICCFPGVDDEDEEVEYSAFAHFATCIVVCLGCLSGRTFANLGVYI